MSMNSCAGARRGGCCSDAAVARAGADAVSRRTRHGVAETSGHFDAGRRRSAISPQRRRHVRAPIRSATTGCTWSAAAVGSTGSSAGEQPPLGAAIQPRVGDERAVLPPVPCGYREASACRMRGEVRHRSGRATSPKPRPLPRPCGAAPGGRTSPCPPGSAGRRSRSPSARAGRPSCRAPPPRSARAWSPGTRPPR